jgi:hypothetical protein
MNAPPFGLNDSEEAIWVSWVHRQCKIALRPIKAAAKTPNSYWNSYSAYNPSYPAYFHPPTRICMKQPKITAHIISRQLTYFLVAPFICLRVPKYGVWRKTQGSSREEKTNFTTLFLCLAEQWTRNSVCGFRWWIAPAFFRVRCAFWGYT